MALCFVSHFNRLSISAAGDAHIMADYSIEPRMMGVVYSAFLLVYSVCMIPGGIFIDRFGPRISLMVVGFGSALFSALTGVTGMAFAGSAQVFFSLILVRSVMGLLSAPLHPASARAVANWIPVEQRSWANGLVTGAAIGGVAFTQVGFGTLMDWFGWPRAFLVTGIVTALLTLIWAVRASDSPSPHRAAPEPAGSRPCEAKSATEWKSLLANRSLMLLTLSYAAVGYFQYLFFYWMHYYFDKVLALGDTTSRYYASIPPLAMALTMPMGGWISDRMQRALGFRLGRIAVPATGMMLSALLLGLGVLAKQPAWIVVWFTLALGAIGASEGSFWSTAVELGGRKGGTAAAICNTGGNVGGMLAPWFTPLLSKEFGWPWGIGAGGLICLLGALCWFWIQPREETNP